MQQLVLQNMVHQLSGAAAALHACTHDQINCELV